MDYYSKTINGIEVNYLKINKHKHIIVAYNFISLYDYQTFNERNMIPNILENNMRKYPTKDKFNLHLDMLYGAIFKADIYSRGNLLANNFYLKFVNKKYLRDQINLTKDAFMFLNELIYNPKTYNNYLTQKSVNDQLYEAKDILKTFNQDKPTHAYINFKKAILNDNKKRLKIYPVEQKLKDVNKITITKSYFDMLNNDQMKIFVIGDFDSEEIDNIIKSNLRPRKITQIQTLKNFNNNNNKINSNVKDIKEVDELSISRLYLGYKVNVNFNSRLYFALNLLNIIIGGYSKSKLFSVIREELNLVYFIYSSYNHDTGILYINFECEPVDENKAIDQIKSIIDAVKHGEFSDLEIIRAKDYLIKQFKSRADSLSGLLNLSILADIEENQRFDLDKTINDYKNITKADLVEASLLLSLDTIYRYTKKDDYND
ncbi:MAG: insulinase family protein [Candidatus Izimaplasma sp.]|nr:insulinase family protein [Candidatus Izimaplasma bacterium]